MKQPSAGFTLLEVLIALAVLAIAMSAIINIATQSINTLGQLRDQTLASWAALNKINEFLLATEPWPNQDSRQGNIELAHRTWRWEARFHKTADPNLTRLELAIRYQDTGPVMTTLTAFKARPLSAKTAAAETTAESSSPQAPVNPSPSVRP